MLDSSQAGGGTTDQVVVLDRRKGVTVVDSLFVDLYMQKVGDKATCVYMALSRHANRDQEAWPSVASIMKKTGIRSNNTVLKAIQELERHGIVRVIRRRCGDGTRAVNCYILQDSELWISDPPSAKIALGKNKRQKFTQFSKKNDKMTKEFNPIQVQYPSAIIALEVNTEKLTRVRSTKIGTRENQNSVDKNRNGPEPISAVIARRKGGDGT